VDQLLLRLSGRRGIGGYKQSGIGRENHKMMLDHYQQTKNLLVSYPPKAVGVF
jgi:aldehyde dehydrogenase